MTYGTLISTQTIGAGGAASIDFTSIPQTYTDLLIVLSGRTSATYVADYFRIKFNTDTTAANYPWKGLFGNGSSASSAGNSTQRFFGDTNGANSTASTFGNAQIYIPNYAGSTNKAVSTDTVSETNATSLEMSMVAALWSSTAAITAISLDSGNGGSWSQYSTASLYGIK